jgi:hypothetical protein
MRNKLSVERRQIIDKFLFSLSGFTKKQWEQSYPSWTRGGRGWWPLQQGGTGIMRALMWYQHVHKPGSREWRPSIIIQALIENTNP